MNRILPTLSHHLGRCGELPFQGSPRTLTGHRSRELERYEHLSPVLKRQTVTRIASVLKCN